MREMKSKDLRDIFLFSRDDMKQLEKDQVVHPENYGQGKAAKFSCEDRQRLLDVKVYMLAGFRITEMPKLFKEPYDSEAEISKQIRRYKKRIQMMEYLQQFKRDQQYFQQFGEEHIFRDGSTMCMNTGAPEYGTDEHLTLMWQSVRMIFLVEYLSTEKSTGDEEEVFNDSLEKVQTVYEIFEQFLQRKGVDTTDEEYWLNIFRLHTWAVCTSKSGVTKLVEKVLSGWKENKDQLLQQIDEKTIDPLLHGVSSEIEQGVRQWWRHTVQFLTEYFLGEEELYFLILNARNYFREIDLKTLTEGKVKLRNGTRLGPSLDRQMDGDKTE